MEKYSDYKIDNRNPEEKKQHVKEMFDSIAPTYDFLNRFLSFGIDRLWRKRLLNLCGSLENQTVLDLCCGTGDLTHEFLVKETDVTSLDFSLGMIKKGVACGWLGHKNVSADATKIPFKEASFNIETIAFGIRNIPDIDVFLKEANRVLTSNGRLFILELTRPENPVVRFFYNIYLRGILPFVGGIFSGRREAYAYLSRTISTFLDVDELKIRIINSGFSDVETVKLTFGVATIYVCKKL